MTNHREYDLSIDGPESFGLAQFTTDDVCAVCGLSAGALKGIVDRNDIDLGEGQRRSELGSGRRRLYSAANIHRISAAVIAKSIGLALVHSNALGEIFEGRALTRLISKGIKAKVPFAVAISSASPDNPEFIAIWRDHADSPLPAAYRYVDVDRIVDETRQKLQAIIGR